MSYIAGEQQSLDDGTATEGPPPWSTVTETVAFVETAEDKSAAEADGVAAYFVDEEGAVDTTLSAGTYAVVCLDFAGPAGARLTSIRVVGPFEVTAS